MARLPSRLHGGENALQRYTLQFKNGRQLRHQEPIALGQFLSDGRLDAYWLEPSPQAYRSTSGFDESSL
jgi:hypothetical protein